MLVVPTTISTTITAGDPAGRQLKSMADAQECRKVQTNHGNRIQTASRPGRRNLTENQRTYMIGKMYEARKNSHGNHAERGEDGKYLSAQNGHLGECRVRQDEVIGRELGIGHNTVRRAEKFAKGIDTLRNVAPEDRGGTLTGHAVSGVLFADGVVTCAPSVTSVTSVTKPIKPSHRRRSGRDT